MKHYWLPHELEACWSLAADEEALLAGESMEMLGIMGELR
jgi:hypothetical protein